MGKLRFRIFVKEINLLNDEFTGAEADLVFADITQNGSILMKYTSFCNALTLLAQKRFKLPTNEALNRLLLHHVLPYAKRHSRDVDEKLNDDVIELLYEYEKPLQRVCSFMMKNDY